jgi:hypothetical protein
MANRLKGIASDARLDRNVGFKSHAIYDALVLDL